MTAPNLGRCVCEPDEDFTLPHEHSDFAPYPCADCDCSAHRPPGQKPSETPPEPPGRPAAIRLPADLGFASERISQAAALLDGILSLHPTIGDPDEPIAVCNLADWLERDWPDAIDPIDVIALATRRLADATNRKPPLRGRLTQITRRMKGNQ